MMSKIRLLLLLALASPAFAQNFGYNGQCAKGGQSVVVQGLLSSGTQPIGGGGLTALGTGVIGSFPSCSVTVFITGSTTPATLVGNKSGSSPLTNPFTANIDGSFLFFSVAGEYDVVMSGGGLPSPVTLTDISLGSGGGGGGGGTPISLQTGGVTNGVQNLLNMAAGAGLSVANVLGTTTYVNTGVLSITTDSQTAIAGPFTTSATDYGKLGITQVGTGTLAILKNSAGFLNIGDTVSFNTNYCQFYPDTQIVGIACSDKSNNFFGMQSTPTFQSPGTGPSVTFGTSATSAINTAIGMNSTDIYGQISTISSPTNHIAFDFTATLGTINVPLNLAAGLSVTGSTNVQNLTVTGTCTGCATGSVATVGVTSNQTVNTGSSSNPVIALFGGANGGSTPLIFPGNAAMIQFANNDTVLAMQRFTDSGPGGFFLTGRQSGGGVLWSVDVSGNALFNSIATSNSSTAGYFGFEQGPDAYSACSTAATASVICEYAPTSVTSYGKILDGTGPASANGSVSVWSNLSSSITQESFMAVSGSTAANIACGTASLAGMANGILAAGDGNGCLKSAGVNVSTILPSLRGPSSPFTTASLTAVSVYTYGSSIAGATTAWIHCSGSYKFTSAAENAAFDLNFSSVPTSIFLNVFIGANATTLTQTYGRQTVNGSLVTAPSVAAATGTYYPVTIDGTVTTNSSTTFDFQAATSNASGTVNIDANSIVCSVK